MNLLDQIRHWPEGLAEIMDWLGSDAKTVHPVVAQERANVCLTCIAHEPKRSVTGTMASAFKRVLELKSKLGLRVAGEKQLGLCSVCGCGTALKIWQTRERIMKQTLETEMQSYPVKCWIKSQNL